MTNEQAIELLQDALEDQQYARARCQARLVLAEAGVRAEKADMTIYDETIMELNLTLERLRGEVYVG